MPDSAHDAPADILELMPRCRGCRFWVNDLGLSDQSAWTSVTDSVTGYCLATVEGSHFRVHGPQNPLGPKSLAHAFDDEGYRAVLVTDAHFGCVQFQRREAANG